MMMFNCGNTFTGDCIYDPYYIRQAYAEEAEKLTELALISKAHWGYPAEWIQKWHDELAVTKEMIENSIAFVAERRRDGQVVGFWCRSVEFSDEPTPGRLFIHPDSMGEGIASMLWQAVKFELLRRGIKSFVIEADPNAVPFYQKIGAKKIGERASQTIPGRKLPVLKVELDAIE